MGSQGNLDPVVGQLELRTESISTHASETSPNIEFTHVTISKHEELLIGRDETKWYVIQTGFGQDTVKK
jgi:hypothetical protein